ncbi:hypothetical protein D3C80_1399390 [compost metagenome]
METRRPPRGRATATAAPTAPMKVMAGEPTRRVSMTAPIATSSMFMNRPSSGEASTSGRPVVTQCARHFTKTVRTSGVSCIRIRSRDPSSRSAWNSRSRPRRADRSAPIQTMAGPMRASRLRSGPTPNGMTATTVMKNSTPISAPPPARMESLISRRKRAVIGASSCSRRYPPLPCRASPPQGGRSAGGFPDASFSNVEIVET